MRTALLFVVCLLASGFIQTGCTDNDSSLVMQRTLDRYVEFWNTGKFDGLEAVLHPDFELLMSPAFETEKGLEAFKARVTKLRMGYPDFHLTVNELVRDVGKTAGRWTITATNTGPGAFPPTGKRVEVVGMSIIHFDGGKIRDEWIAGNDLAWLGQLGFTVVPPQPK